MSKPRLLRVTTVPISLKLLLKGQPEFFTAQGFEVLTASAAGKEVEDLKKLGIHHITVPMTRKITPFRDLIALGKMVRAIQKFKPDIIHTHTPKAGLIGMLAGWLCGVNVRIHTVAGMPLMESTGLKRKLLILTERITYACAHEVYPNAEGLKSFIQQHIKTSTPLRVIGKGSTNGINVSYFNTSEELAAKGEAIRKEFNLSPDAFVFGFIGRIVKDKGIQELTEAFQQLLENSTKKIHLILVGSFEQELDPVNQKTFEFLHTNPNVTLAGFRDDVRPWLMASNAFVFPSYREGFPNVVLQACCLERCCIVSDINGCNEIVTNNKTGIIVKPKNAQALYEAMQHAIKNEDQVRAFGQAARQYVVTNFSQQNIWNELLQAYKRLLKVN